MAVQFAIIVIPNCMTNIFSIKIVYNDLSVSHQSRVTGMKLVGGSRE